MIHFKHSIFLAVFLTSVSSFADCSPSALEGKWSHSEYSEQLQAGHDTTWEFHEGTLVSTTGYTDDWSHSENRGPFFETMADSLVSIAKNCTMTVTAVAEAESTLRQYGNPMAANVPDAIKEVKGQITSYRLSLSTDGKALVVTDSDGKNTSFTRAN
jgi:hypothetical protein